MKRVITAIILVPIVVLALFKAPIWLFTLLVLAVAMLAAREYLDIAQATGFTPFRNWSYFLLACGFYLLLWQLAQAQFPAFFAQGLAMRAVAMLALLASPFLLLGLALRRDPLAKALPDAAVSFLLLFYVGLPLLSLPLMRVLSNGAMYLLFVMLIVWAGDIASYYVGRAIGKNKLAPRISPGKTIEGTIASVVGAVAVGVLLFHFINPIAAALVRVHLVNPTGYTSVMGVGDVMPHYMPAPLWVVALMAALINIAAQIGDLVESALKRGAGMKDSGGLLPGHGGVLDRIDALLFAMPVALLFFLAGLVRYFEPTVR